MIRIGPAGWNYKDWAGIVYPQTRPRTFSEPGYLAHYFDTLEINTSFYGPPRRETVRKWVEATAHNSAFRFTAKLWRGFTHERNATAKDEALMKDGFAPLVEAHRLGAVLMQFPWAFKNTPENRSYVARLSAIFREYPLVLEVRHASWNEAGILDFLEQLRVAMCNIDQPLFQRSIRPGAEVTAPTGYIRLHGRNYKTWFSENAQSHERYDYLYSLEELAPWTDRVKAVDGRAEDTYVIGNNHYLGKATVNALELSAILRGERVKAPRELLERYPELREFAVEG